ncbi:MAG: hypothetical protein IJ588_01625 [Prevotella sp.]|nr:hypothetical protein [Prevotella sp.]
MKNVKFFFAAFVLLAASCSNDESLDSSVNLSSEQGLAPVTVSVSGFAVEQGDFPGTGEPQGTRAATRAQSVSDYANVKFLTLAFYKSDGTEVYKQTQNRDDDATYDTFGEFSTSLPMGSYTMVVVANGGSNVPTLTSATSATYGENVVGDTFVKSQEVNITSTEAVNLDATLDRIVTCIAVDSSDGRTEEAKKLRITTTTGGRSFSPTTGLATVNSGITAMITLPEAVGTVTKSASLLFLAADEQTADVTIETLDADDNVLFSKTVENVPLKRNRWTILTGAMYQTTASGTFSVNTDWLTNENVNF